MRWLVLLLPAGCTTLDQLVASRAERCASLNLPANCVGGEDTGDPSGETPVPDDLGPIDDIAIGDAATCVIPEDGSLRCWYALSIPSDWELGQPSGGPWQSVHFGFEHACARRTNGALDCWGRDFQFESDDESPDERFRAGPYQDVALGVRHGCGERGDGAWECWAFPDGWDDGQPVLQNVDDLSVWNGACAILGGAVQCWGENNNPAFPGIDAVQVEMGPGGVCVRDRSRDLWCVVRERGAWSEPERLARQVDDFTRPDESLSICILSDNDIDCVGPTVGVIDDDTDLPIVGPFVQVEAVRNVVCGVSRSGELSCWGIEADGRFPDDG